MKKLAIFGFTPREEVIVNSVRRDMPRTEIALFSGIPNRALEERVDHVHGITDKDIGFLKQWKADVTLIGPDRFSSMGIQEKLRTAGIKAVGADANQIRFETDRSLLRNEHPAVKKYFPPFEIINSWNEANVRGCLRSIGKFALKYNGVYEEIGGGTKLSGLHLRSEEEALAFAQKSIQESGSVVIEEIVNGIDFSVNALTASDGSLFFFPENYCYKLRDDNNLGPNTSGTGSFAYSKNLPYMTDEQQRAARDICREIVERINFKSAVPLVTGLNFDFRLGDDNKIYLFEMNTRFAGSGTLSTIMDITANPTLELLETALRGSFRGVEYNARALTSLGVFTYPKFFPGKAKSDVQVRIPKAISMPKGVNCFTGWVEVLEETAMDRSVILKNSTTQLFQTSDNSLNICQERLAPLLRNMPVELEFRRDIGDLDAIFLQPGISVGVLSEKIERSTQSRSPQCNIHQQP